MLRRCVHAFGVVNYGRGYNEVRVFKPAMWRLCELREYKKMACSQAGEFYNEEGF